MDGKTRVEVAGEKSVSFEFNQEAKSQGKGRRSRVVQASDDGALTLSGPINGIGPMNGISFKGSNETLK